MKILLCVLYYEPAWAYGGPPRMVFDVARTLVERGHEVTVCTTDALDRGKRIAALRETSHGVRIVRFRNASSTLAFRAKILLPLGMRRWLRDNVRGFDVVHLFETRTMLNAWASRFASRARVPLVASVWGSLPRGDGWQAWVKAAYDRLVLPSQLGGARALLAQNEHEAALYREHGADPRRIRLWPLAVDLEALGPSPARGAFRAKHGIAPDARVVLFVGRIHAQKGLETLMRAFAKASANVPSAHLLIVGRDDGWLDAMRALSMRLGLEARMTFAGPLYGEHALGAYVDSDLFCMTPTHFEETSLAALTAAACGRALLLNDRCGVPWLSEHDAGREVPHDVELIAMHMSALLSDDDLRERIGARAAQMIEQRFALPRIIDQLEQIYADAIEPADPQTKLEVAHVA